MTGQRRRRVVSQLLSGTAHGLEAERLCRVCADVTAMSGAEIMLMSGDTAQGSLYPTDGVSVQLGGLQHVLGEGPCVDAYRDDRPVLEPDLAHPTFVRWVAFPGGALEAGAAAVFAFPLRVGAVRVGVLSLYRDRPGPLSDDQHADALVAADVAAQVILILQADAPPGTLAAALEAGTDLHREVHQAAGMVAAQLDISVAQALVRLRAHAFGSGGALTEVAGDVVARRLRFDGRGGDGDPRP